MGGALGFSVLRFWIFFWSVFRFLCQKTSVFRFWCSMRLADFLFFSIWYSVFVKNTSGFSVLVPNVVFGFSYLFSYLDLFGYTVLYAVFGFGRFCLRFWKNFSPVLRFLVYPNAPLLNLLNLRSGVPLFLRWEGTPDTITWLFVCC